MAFSLKTPFALLYIASLVACKPVLVSRQDDAPSDENNTKEFWCDRWDTTNIESIQELWEGDETRVGQWLAEWIEDNAAGEGPNDDWATRMLKTANPSADTGDLGGCGVVGSTRCSVPIKCEDWAPKGFGPHFWAIKALMGFHSKQSVAHEYLQDNTLNNLMELPKIAADFTSPDTWSTTDDLYAVLGAIFYVVGGLAGGIGLATSTIGKAAGAMGTARVGVAKAGKARTQKTLDKLADGDAKKALQERLDKTVETAQAMADRVQKDFGSIGATAATLGTSTYMVGGIFGAVGIGSEDPYGKVDADDLTTALGDIFAHAQKFLEQLGRLASGRANPDEGDDYEFLPGQDGASGKYTNDNAIAMFFHDGGMLVEDADPTFNQTLNLAFGTIKPRIVDAALKTGGFFVFADELLEDEKDCIDARDVGEEDNHPWFASEWIEGAGCMRLMRESESTQTCQGGANRCYYLPATEANYASLVDTYGFNMKEYFQAVFDCTKSDQTGPDLMALPDNFEYPLCWFSLEARKGLESCGDSISQGDGPVDCNIDFSDF